MKNDRSSQGKATRAILIAPCGMNCRLCRAYGRDQKPCPGCRNDDGEKAKSCAACSIKNCVKLKSRGIRFCFSCDEFPCARLEHLDKRYRSKYGMSMIENLRNIKQSGVRRFVRSEHERWKCPRCGNTLCVHRPECGSCGRQWLQHVTPG